MAQAAAAPDPSPLPAALVLYDGVCGFCDRTVQWLLAHDPDGRLHYATLQGETAAALRRLHPEIPRDLDTLVLVESANRHSRVYMRSQAVLRVVSRLAPPWHRLAWLRVVPRPLADLAYGVFVRWRYRLFGKLDSCRIPTPAERARFLA